MPNSMPIARGQEHELRAPLHPKAFDGETLVLGAGTALAVADRRLFLTKRDSEAFDEARVAALLAVACRRAITPSQLRYVREALRRRSEGETTLALTHLALANLPKLNPPEEAAWRLTAADRLLKGGMSPAEMLSALGLAPATAAGVERAYNRTSRAFRPAMAGRAGNGRTRMPSPTRPRTPPNRLRPTTPAEAAPMRQFGSPTRLKIGRNF